LGFGALPGNIEPFMIERLKEIVEGVHFKCLHCVLIVGRSEDNVRRMLLLEGFKHFEAA